MPVDKNSQAGLDGEEIVEETAEVPEQTPAEGSAGEEPQKESETFTRADVEAMLAEQEKRLTSAIQSQVAKSENRTNTRIQERLAALDVNRATLQLTDEQYEKAQDEIIREEQANAFKRKDARESSQTQSGDGEAEQVQFMQLVENIFTQEGTRLTPKDKEWEELVKPIWDDPASNPIDSLLALKEAVRAKASRLKAFKGSAKVRVAGGGESGSTQTKPKTAEEKISAGLKQTQWRSDTPQK